MNKLPLLVLTVALGCNAGPEQPLFYQGVALSLQVHLADPPRPDELRSELMVGLDPLAYCAPAAADPADGFNRAATSGIAGGATPFDPTAPSLRVTLGSGRNGASCENGAWLRFFRPAATMQENGESVGPWLAQGQDVVWAREPTTLALFGPDGPQVSFPAGYSLLHNTCASGHLVPVVEPVDTVIELHHPARGADWSGRVGLEREQADLLAACGVTPPAPDRGARISVDTPLTLRWSPDGARFYYFVPDEGVHARLRSLAAAGGATAELAVGLRADTLILPATGDVYVTDNQPGLLRGRPQPDGSLRFEPIPDGFTLVSPDGRWIAGSTPGPAPKLVVQDLMTSESRVVDGGFASGWSPDSRRLAYFQWAARGRPESPLRVWIVETGEIATVGPGENADWLPGGQLAVKQLDTGRPGAETVRVFGAEGGPLGEFNFSSYMGAHVWVSGRLVRLAGLPWLVETVGGSPAERSQAGLEIEDPSTGSRHTVIPPDRMLLGYPDTDATVVTEGVVLIWTRPCRGFYETACTFELHRLSVAEGGDQVLATTPDLTAFALSPDGKQVAIGTRDGIFVKTLP